VHSALHKLAAGYAEQLPRSNRYRNHADNIAYYVHEGQVACVKAYLEAVSEDWSHRTRSLSREHFRQFAQNVVLDAKKSRARWMPSYWERKLMPGA